MFVKTLTTLEIDMCGIGDDGMEYLAEVLRNHKVNRFLDLFK